MNKENWVEIKRGAEASVWKVNLFGKDCIAKNQEPKKWRIESLDLKLRNERLHNEARTNMKCVKLGIPTAPIVFIDLEQYILFMEELSGPTIKKAIFDLIDENDAKIVRALEDMGKIIATLHNNDVIHADLTTSNFMFHNGTVCVIDFGLSFASSMEEDMAVDLYVMERAFNSSHPGKGHLLQVVFDSYVKHSKIAEKVMRRLKKVRSRGRKRSMVG